MTTELLTKEEIGRELNPDEPLSVRSVERYIQLAEVTPAVKGKGRGQLSKFRRADVDKIVAAYRTAQDEQRRTREGAQALTTVRHTALERVELVSAQAEGFRSLSERLDPWPPWLTTKQALELSGLPHSWLYSGLRKGMVASAGTRYTRRIHRDDLRAFIERTRESEFVARLLEKAT
jgi:hypothetical protein